METAEMRERRIERERRTLRVVGNDLHITLGVFTKDGMGHPFTSVNPDSIAYFNQDGVWFLRFQSGPRWFVFPNVTYWTEDKA